MAERVRAGSQLAQLIDEQERRVRERTADGSEVAVRREAEETRNPASSASTAAPDHARDQRRRDPQHLDVVVRSLESSCRSTCLPGLYDAGSNVLTVSKVGPRCTVLARKLGLTERARWPSTASPGALRPRQPVSEPTPAWSPRRCPAPRQAGLRSLVVSPLKIRSACSRADRGATDGAGSATGR